MSTMPDFDPNEPISDEEIIGSYNEEIQATLDEIGKLITYHHRLVEQRRKLLKRHGKDTNQPTVE